MRNAALALCVAIMCSGCQDLAVRDVDVLALKATEGGSPGGSDYDNWFRSFNEKEGAWWQRSSSTEPFADFDTVKRDCDEYLKRTRGKDSQLMLAFSAHHARLWVLSYVQKPRPSGVVAIGGCYLWYDTLKRRVVAETYYD